MGRGVMEFVVLIGLIALNGLFALSELAIVSSRRARLQIMADKGNLGAATALKLQEDPSRFLSTVQIGITLIGIIAGAYGATALAEDFAPLVARLGPPFAEHAGTLAFGVVIAITTFLSLVIGELVPKRVAMTAPETFASLMAPAMRWLSLATFPVVWFLRGSTNLLLALMGLSRNNDNQVTEEEVQQIIEEGHASGALEEEERTMLQGVMRLADRDVRSIMTPRSEVVWLDLDDPKDTLMQRMASSGHSRFPMARGDLEHTIGIVQTKDLLAQSGGTRLPDFEKAAHMPVFVPETLSVMKLLDSMQGNPVRMALVIDELGTVEGIVTAADVLGAIAGETAFAADDRLPSPVMRDDGSWLVDGRTALEDLEILLSVPSLGEDAGVSTLAGLIMHHLQRVPALGDHVAENGWRFEVVDMDGRRVDSVLISRVDAGVERTSLAD